MGFNCELKLHNKNKVDNFAYIGFLDWVKISDRIDTTLMWMGEYKEIDDKYIIIKASDFVKFGLKLEELAHFINRFSKRIQNEISEYDLHSLKKAEKTELEDIMFQLKDDVEYEDIFFAENIYIAAKFLSNIENIDDIFEIIYIRSY